MINADSLGKLDDIQKGGILFYKKTAWSSLDTPGCMPISEAEVKRMKTLPHGWKQRVIMQFTKKKRLLGKETITIRLFKPLI